ncbi:MAG: hypothetical protein AMXMBFR4_32460 [Candidatus Hydrogenedentota bacterium]
MKEAIDRVQRTRILAGYPLVLAFAALSAISLETDQYLVWEVELNDSADAFNRYLNGEIETFLERQNARRDPTTSAEELTLQLYYYLFNGLHSSRLRHWLHTSPEVDRYPPNSVRYAEHLRMSVFNMRSFPFILPMSRTIRLGDVYLGIDKMGHFFGFGRRSFRHYLKLREDGLIEGEAIEQTILRGYFMERYFVGNVMDGVFSYADLEANFQGMVMARAFCEGEDAYFRRMNGKWVLTRPVDIRLFITPYFDESYNRSHYIGRRKRHVIREIQEKVCPKLQSPLVQQRFEHYRQWPPSYCQQVVREHQERLGKDYRSEQDLEKLCDSLRQAGQAGTDISSR